MVEYVFDEAKRQWNLDERGLDFADAGLVYENPAKATFASPQKGEARQQDIAMVELLGTVLTLVYIERGSKVRVISYRKASRKERLRYAKFVADKSN